MLIIFCVFKFSSIISPFSLYLGIILHKSIKMRKLYFLFLSFLFLYCSEPKKKINPKIEIFDSSIQSIIDIYSDIEILADSITLPEGPVWDKETKSLLFVDVAKNKILRWNEEYGATDFISPGGNTGYAPNLGEGLLGPNGLVINQEGKLFVCQHGDRRIAMINKSQSNNPNFETLIDNYKGKRLNSPNDLIISKDGSIFFTDPPFSFFDLNTFSFVDSELRELDFNGVYRLETKTNETSLISKDIEVPNGIGISPDEKFLYVNKMGPPFSNTSSKIIKIDLETLESETLYEGVEMFQKFKDSGDFDGMAIHSSGNIFTSGPGGLLVISPEGELKARIDFSHITNCTFDDEEKYLYATGFIDNPKVYRIKLK